MAEGKDYKIRIHAQPDLEPGLEKARQQLRRFQKSVRESVRTDFGNLGGPVGKLLRGFGLSPVAGAAAGVSVGLFGLSRFASALEHWSSELARIHVETLKGNLSEAEAIRQRELATPIIGFFRRIQDGFQALFERGLADLSGTAVLADIEAEEKARTEIRKIYQDRERSLRAALRSAKAGLPGTDPLTALAEQRKGALDELREQFAEFPSAFRDFARESQLREIVDETYKAIATTIKVGIAQAGRAAMVQTHIKEAQAEGYREYAEALSIRERMVQAVMRASGPKEADALFWQYYAEIRMLNDRIRESIKVQAEEARISLLVGQGKTREARIARLREDQRRRLAAAGHGTMQEALERDIFPMEWAALAAQRERELEGRRASLMEQVLRARGRPLEADLFSLRERIKGSLRDVAGDQELQRLILAGGAMEEMQLLRREAARRAGGVGGGAISAVVLGPGLHGLAAQSEIRADREQTTMLERIHRQLMDQYALWERFLPRLNEQGGFVMP
jgi:hypothetical protein